MKSIINLYCEMIIYTIEEKKKELMKEIVLHPYLEKCGKYYLEQYDRLLFEKYCELEQLLKENDY